AGCIIVTASATIFTLSLLDALPISDRVGVADVCLDHLGTLRQRPGAGLAAVEHGQLHPGRDRPGRARGADDAGAADEQNLQGGQDRKSTRLNSSHVKSSYAVFCLKK